MRFALAAAALILNALDNFTTYSCLYRPVPGYEVYEANPLAAWGFQALGLESALIFEMALTTLAIAFLVYSRTFSWTLRMSLLVAMVILPAWAVVNNVQVMQSLGITPVLGG